jgi:hypothetical protein
MQAFKLAAFAVGKLQIKPFQPVRAGVVLGDAVDDGQTVAHATVPAAIMAR